jgi:acetoin utilization deacetylase AcuC-like enzyme
MLPVVFHPHYDAQSVPDGHRFPMRKYAHLRTLLQTADFADRLLWRLGVPASREQVLRAHATDYVDAVLSQSVAPTLARRIGFAVTEDVARRSLAACGGTLTAARIALEAGIAANTAGGSHHAGPDGGAGFCVFNDVAVAALDLLETGSVDRILVVDCDVHHGDGTARIFARDPRVFTLSVHCDDNWPREKPTSDLDVGLPKGAGDVAYLDALRPALEAALAQARPNLVFFNAGVDPHGEDRLGLLDLTDRGLQARDRLVLDACRTRQAPLCAVMGGGYGDDPLEVARRHMLVFETLSAAPPPCGG